MNDVPARGPATTRDGDQAEGRGIHLAPGTMVDGEKYEIVEFLGAGGMGVVYRARQRSLGREVALKLLNAGHAREPEARRRFLREAKVASALTHPSVVQIFDVGEAENGVIYLAMEFLRGRTLWEVIGGGAPTLPLATSLAIAGQLADALVAAHDLPLVHRDLKPENIFLEDAEAGWRVVVVDFGLAFMPGQGGELGRMTREGLVVGTPPYLSPEQAGGLEVGTPADVYAFGCVTYELLTGAPPFQGSELHVLTQHLYVAPSAPSERALDRRIPRELDALVLSMLRKRPEERPTMREVREGLAKVEGTLAGARNRGRDANAVETRQARMVSVPPELAREAPLLADTASVGEAIEAQVGVVGPLDETLWIGLRTNGWLAEAVDGEADGDELATNYDLLLCTADAPDALARLVATGVPVVASTGTHDMAALAAMARLGVSEVVRRPLSIDDLVRALRRAHRRRRREDASTTLVRGPRPEGGQ